MHAVIAESGSEAGSQGLLAHLLCPGIGALVDRDDELRDISQDLKELDFGGFHG